MGFLFSIIKGFFVHIFFPLVVNILFLFFNINELEVISPWFGNFIIIFSLVWLVIGVIFALIGFKNQLVQSRDKKNELMGVSFESEPPLFRKNAQKSKFRGFYFLFLVEKEIEPSQYNMFYASNSSLRIGYLDGPYCPMDETYLESNKTFLGKYKYVCDECGFTNKVVEGPFTLRRKAKMVFDSRLHRN